MNAVTDTGNRVDVGIDCVVCACIHRAEGVPNNFDGLDSIATRQQTAEAIVTIDIAHQGAQDRSTLTAIQQLDNDCRKGTSLAS